jgi:hypothetical protein
VSFCSRLESHLDFNYSNQEDISEDNMSEWTLEELKEQVDKVGGPHMSEIIQEHETTLRWKYLNRHELHTSRKDGSLVILYKKYLYEEKIIERNTIEYSLFNHLIHHHMKTIIVTNKSHFLSLKNELQFKVYCPIWIEWIFDFNLVLQSRFYKVVPGCKKGRSSVWKCFLPSILQLQINNQSASILDCLALSIVSFSNKETILSKEVCKVCLDRIEYCLEQMKLEFHSTIDTNVNVNANANEEFKPKSDFQIHKSIYGIRWCHRRTTEIILAYCMYWFKHKILSSFNDTLKNLIEVYLHNGCINYPFSFQHITPEFKDEILTPTPNSNVNKKQKDTKSGSKSGSKSDNENEISEDEDGGYSLNSIYISDHCYSNIKDFLLATLKGQYID